MGIYRFKICGPEDIGRLLNFIDTYWKKNHILVRSKEILDFQYFNKEENNYTFVLAENTQTGEIDGIRGWIRLAQYDPALAPNDDVWSAISKVRTDVENEEIKLLGSYLWRYLDRHKGFGTVGISKYSFAMHTAIRHKTCSLSQYFILNPNNQEYKIAKIPSYYKPPCVVNISDWSIKQIEDISTVSNEEICAYYRPFKSITYLVNRFLKHPVYKYLFYGIFNGNKMTTILVGKYVEINNSKILRIVDVLGCMDNVGCLYNEFVRLIEDSLCEYVDFLCYGIDSSVFERMGFAQLNPESEDIVIPNYFEPFLQENIVINGAFKPAERYTMFKADADQDRPS